ncbi:hypothetical protein PTSG_04253 [Salpingoeca rosetta]|uniref:Kinesin-like protein n=1 Tax=Salpingoeca rosetta (strain ATCC 50818 / BSB-021) TaxID=946362 RepID=F2U714_SALR5|nr:uncharacterized protein PTSG_04253 [Salpingoeca rosetta]EGD83646.1 hypothetical protein PTSG_04253 [Salpingoeca rosetta]|eukprot:XP_004995150.1 hypothetical protein PTSG_04253 [Salpingoeca rosetta]
MDSGNVRVAVRVRCVLEHEQDEELCLTQADKAIQLYNWKSPTDTLKFRFDACYNEEASQKEIFMGEVKPLLDLPLKGFNATCFAYGPTGAGKTFTMQGTKQHPGIIPRSIKHMFQLVNRRTKDTQQFTVSMSFLEIYQEKVYDLLEPKDHDLTILQDASGSIVVPDLAEVPIQSVKDFEATYNSGLEQRATHSTALNAHSSRSHAVLTIKVQSRACKNGEWNARVGKLHLIDLAGSEDNRKTGNVGDRMKESTAINKSLFALNQVVDAINRKQARIPYRESKLTRFLQEALGGNSVAKILTCLGPTKNMYFNTYHALNFASKSRQVVNKPFEARTTRVNAAGKAQPTPAASTSSGPIVRPSRANAGGKRSAAAADGSEDNTSKRANRRPAGPSSSASSRAPHASSLRREIQTEGSRRPTKQAATATAGKGKDGSLTQRLEHRVQQLEKYMTDVMLAQMNGQQQQQQQQQDAADTATESETTTSAVQKATFSSSMTEEQRVHVAKSIIKVAKAFKSSGDLPSALRHYEEALELLPKHEGLRAKVEALRKKVANRAGKTNAGEGKNESDTAKADKNRIPADHIDSTTSNSTTATAATTTSSKQSKKGGTVTEKTTNLLQQSRQRMAMLGGSTFRARAADKGKMKDTLGRKKLEVFDEFATPVRGLGGRPATHAQGHPAAAAAARKPLAKRKPLCPIQHPPKKGHQDNLNDSTQEDPTWSPENEEEDAMNDGMLKYFEPRDSVRRKRPKVAHVPPTLMATLNEANAKELMELNGIGKKRAQAILAHRQLRGNFESVADLHECGLTDGILSRLVMTHVVV